MEMLGILCHYQQESPLVTMKILQLPPVYMMQIIMVALRLPAHHSGQVILVSMHNLPAEMEVI